MAERLADAVSPYLRAHAGNPVDWYPWGEEAFAAARERDVPVLVSIGYATCHWCHVMARESFSDPALAAALNDRFVAIKVDREEHPDVDAACMTAAGAFTPDLGWPLNVFMTPDGRVFHAGTYSPPAPVQGHPSFAQVLGAVGDAWGERRGEVESSAAQLAAALREATGTLPPAGAIGADDLAAVVDELAGYEDPQHGGFGGAPKFPVAPVLLTALALARSPLLDAERRDRIRGVALRALVAMRLGELRDPVGGGFFRYATRRDWSTPHYERMLVDNALLLRAYAEAGDRETAAGIVAFLRDVLRRPSGAFGSAQDSESDVDGRRSEGGYYALTAEERGAQPAPAVDGKVLSGWNGLAIGALARAGVLLGERDWIALAEQAADAVLSEHLGADGVLARASLDGRRSGAPATLEDHGALAEGLLELAVVSGRVDLATTAQALVEACRTPEGFRAPAGGDPLLAAIGAGPEADPSEGAGPSGLTSIAGAAWRLHLLTADPSLLAESTAALAPHVAAAVQRPMGAGALLGLAARQLEPVRQVVVVTPDPLAPLVRAAAVDAAAAVLAVVDEPASAAFAAAGFELFEGRGAQDGRPTAYVCLDFVCRLPVTDPAAFSPAG